MQGLHVDYIVSAVGHTCTMWQHMCSGAYANNVECVYTNASGYNEMKDSQKSMPIYDNVS